MAKQTPPNKKELEDLGALCSRALSRREGTRVDVTVEPFFFPDNITKSRIFGYNINSAGTGGTVRIPNQLTIKQYIPGVRGMTDDKDRVSEEFRTEKAILEIESYESGNSSRVFPDIYSRGVKECDEKMIIIREFIDGDNLVETAKKQNILGTTKWESAPLSPGISSALNPITLWHAKSYQIASALKERGLLQLGTPDTINIDELAEREANNHGIYNTILLKGTGTRIKEKDMQRLKACFKKLNKEFVSTRSLLRVINGELDVFPHHGMLERQLDAGGAVVGGLVRDLAVFSAPQFNWPDPMDMVKKVNPTYDKLARKFASDLMYSQPDWNEKVLCLGLLFASFNGNFRKGAATVHYRKGDKEYPLEEEVSMYLPNGIKYLDSFIENSDGKARDRAREIRIILNKYGLDAEKYQLGKHKKYSRYSLPNPAEKWQAEGMRLKNMETNPA